MEPNNLKDGGRRLRPREEIMKLLDDYEKSEGISVKDYCDMIGISDATFYNWQKRFRPEQGTGDMNAGFIPVEITGPPAVGDPLQMVEVRIIKFYGGLPAENFKALLS